MTKTSNKFFALYTIIGILWIFFSDRSFRYFGYPESSVFFQTLKGIGFIVISGIIFWLMLRNAERKNENYIKEIRKATENLRYSNERYIAATKATNSVIWDWDFSTDIVLWGKSLTRVLSYETFENHIAWWLEKIHPDDRERVSAKVARFITSAPKERWSDEYRIVHTSGQIRYIYDRGYLLFNKKGKPIRMIGAIEDITERKTNEEQLLELNTQINKRIHELAISNAELEQFVQIASHDLQEPLRMVTGFLTLIEKKYHSLLDEAGKEYIYFAVDGARRMRQLMLALLEYSKVGRTEFATETIDVSQLITEISILDKAIIDEKNVTITVGKLPVISGRKVLIQQVFHNLIVNAIKYKKTDCDPIIAVEATENETFWQFAVTDNGIGINPAFFERIFVIFQRLHPKDENSGTGMGLSICRKIIESHGGKIWIASEEGKGSTFYFTIEK